MCYVPYVAIFYSISKWERYQWCLYVMLCREQVLYHYRDCFSTVFPQNLPYIQFLLASCALHYDVDRMYDLQDLQLFLCLLPVAPQSVSTSCNGTSIQILSPLLYEIFFCFQYMKWVVSTLPAKGLLHWALR